MAAISRIFTGLTPSRTVAEYPKVFQKNPKSIVKFVIF